MSPRSLISKPDFSAEHHQWYHLLWELKVLGWGCLEETVQNCSAWLAREPLPCCVIGLGTYIFSAAPLSEWTPHFSAGVGQLQIWLQLSCSEIKSWNTWPNAHLHPLKGSNRVMAADTSQGTKISMSTRLKAFSFHVSLPPFPHTWTKLGNETLPPFSERCEVDLRVFIYSSPQMSIACGVGYSGLRGMMALMRFLFRGLYLLKYQEMCSRTQCNKNWILQGVEHLPWDAESSQCLMEDCHRNLAL